MALAFGMAWSGIPPVVRLPGVRAGGDGDGGGGAAVGGRPTARCDSTALSSVQVQSFSRARVRLRVAKRRKEVDEWFAWRPRLTISACVAIFRNRLSPLARPSRLRIWVAGNEKG